MTTYVEGSWLAVVTPRWVLMVRDLPAEAVRTLAPAVDAAGLGGFIDELARATGTTVVSLPPFAVAVAEEHGVRVAVRGDAVAADATDSERRRLTGAGVTGWAEAVWPSASMVELWGNGSPAGDELWIVEGAVRVASVSWSPAEGSQRGAPPPAVERTATPVAPAAPSTEVPPAPPTAVTPVQPAVDAIAEVEAEGAEKPQEDEVSLETLAPEYDTAVPATGDAPYDTVFGSLWGATSSAPPAQDEAPAETATVPDDAARPAPVPVAEGDHDGATVSIAALRAMTAPPPSSGTTTTPTFASPDQLDKESRSRAVVSTGAVVTLDKNVIIGRTPKASRVTGEMPHLVTVPSPSQDISRSHVELRVEGTAVVAVDLNTTNGTLVKREGTDPVRLHPGEPHVLLSGDVIDLGDGVTVVLEDLP